ncbi:hypothetical protein D5086_020011 [Populus alba]|uniref:Uncharacterized protein n=1 Tax=Populus alba TaxID=43335 RepID=A0ACC4BJG8_POPAL
MGRDDFRKRHTYNVQKDWHSRLVDASTIDQDKRHQDSKAIQLMICSFWAMPPTAAQDRLLARWKFLRSHGLNLQPNAWLYGLTLANIQKSLFFFQVSRSQSGRHTDTVSTVPSKAPPTSHTYTPSKFKPPDGALRILYANHRPLH